MIEIVINYDLAEKEYKVYEPSTDTLLVSQNLTEALVNLSLFLMTEGLTDSDILERSDISYHIDSYTMKSIVETNVNLIKQLKAAPSGFMLSSQRFGGNSSPNQHKSNKGDFKESFKGFNSKKSSSFSTNTGFGKASKKFGGK